jgi:Zn-dependent protease with chaperone function
MKTALLLGLLSAILIVGGRTIAGDEGVKYGFILAVGMNFFTYFFSEKMALMSARGAAITCLAQMAMWFGAGSRDDRRSHSPLGGLLILLLAAMAAALIRMAISRTREFSADATSAHTLGTPQPMIEALAKLDSAARRIPLDASPAMSHMYIIQPFAGGLFLRLFSTGALRRVQLDRQAA